MNKNTLQIFQIDAFTSEIFKGNPACVMPLDNWLPDDTLLKIAKENNVSETAYFIKKEDHFYLRWFTPEIEMDLCGHATLATAYCLRNHLNYKKDSVKFDSMSGELVVKFNADYMQMDFPHRKPVKSDLPQNILDSLSIKPIEILKSRDYVLIYDNEDQIKNIKIDKELFDRKNIDPGGVVITSVGTKSDFVSRYFVPQCSFFEDPVTGSTHCSLVPYWSEKLNKKKLKSIQLSERGGEMICEDVLNRVLINGKAVTYSEGHVHLKY
jgi:PhzF family phenazine biosynthesis protein